MPFPRLRSHSTTRIEQLKRLAPPPSLRARRPLDLPAAGAGAPANVRTLRAASLTASVPIDYAAVLQDVERSPRLHGQPPRCRSGALERGQHPGQIRVRNSQPRRLQWSESEA